MFRTLVGYMSRDEPRYHLEHNKYFRPPKVLRRAFSGILLLLAISVVNLLLARCTILLLDVLSRMDCRCPLAMLSLAGL